MTWLRAHVLSLAAAFLALAVGMALGSGLLSDTARSGLRADNERLHARIDDLSAERTTLDRQLAAAGEFDTAVAPRTLRGALTGVAVLVVRTPDADAGDVDAVRQMLGAAGAIATGTVELTEQFVDANAAEKLLSVVNSPIVPAGRALSTTATDQGSAAGDLVGIAVLRARSRPPASAPTPGPVSGPVPGVADAERDTVLRTLRDTAFVRFPDAIGAADAAVIVTGGALAPDAGNRGATVARFAAGLAAHGSTVLAGRTGCASGTAAVAVVRADPGLSNAVSTIDDVERPAGAITAALALADLDGGGRSGQYGLGPGASAVTVAS